MSSTQDSALESRTTPVQQRGHARVDALLDAAAEIVEASGIAAMTTSAIAERSGSSVGVVYRYFPNADAVLIALAERNRERYSAGIAEALQERPPEDWTAFAGLCVDTYAALAVSVPAFRVIRFGDVVAMRFAHRESSNNEWFALRLDSILVERYGFAATDDLAFATAIALECADAVTRRAFLRSRDADPRFIDAAKQIIVGIIAPHAPDAAARGATP